MSVSYRRFLLDKMLCEHSSVLQGRVMDIGGKKDNKRGHFLPPIKDVLCWHYLNLDQSTNPDFCCDAISIPISGGDYDAVLLCEVLEHVENPNEVLKEAWRILRQGGTLVLSMPLLFPIHADPGDYQRWTNTKIQIVLESIGFSQIVIKPMGGVGAVIYDVLYVLSQRNGERLYAKVLSTVLAVLRQFFFIIERCSASTAEYITTGYFVTARKL